MRDIHTLDNFCRTLFVIKEEKNAKRLGDQIKADHACFHLNFKVKSITNVQLPIARTLLKHGAQQWVETMWQDKRNGGTVVLYVQYPMRRKLYYQVRKVEMNAEQLVDQILAKHVSFRSSFKTKSTMNVHLTPTTNQKLGAQPKLTVMETMLWGKRSGDTVVRCVLKLIRKKLISQILKITKKLDHLQEYRNLHKLIYRSVLELMRVGASQPNQIAVPQLQRKVVRNTANYAKNKSVKINNHGVRRLDLTVVCQRQRKTVKNTVACVEVPYTLTGFRIPQPRNTDWKRRPSCVITDVELMEVVRFSTLDHRDVDRLWDPVSHNLMAEVVREHQENVMIATKK